MANDPRRARQRGNIGDGQLAVWTDGFAGRNPSHRADPARAWAGVSLLHPTQAPSAAPREAFKSLEDARETLLNRVRQAAFLVDSRVAADDALEYKKLMMSVAERTAQAALEGGFLGLGGVQVSDAERTVLEELRVQLRLEGTAATR